MRPIVEPTRPTPGRPTENLTRAKPAGNSESSATSRANWRSMRSEFSGTFPAADRCGRVSSEDAGKLCLRLRLSLSLPLNSVRRAEYTKKPPSSLPYRRVRPIVTHGRIYGLSMRKGFLPAFRSLPAGKAISGTVLARDNVAFTRLGCANMTLVQVMDAQPPTSSTDGLILFLLTWPLPFGLSNPPRRPLILRTFTADLQSRLAVQGPPKRGSSVLPPMREEKRRGWHPTQRSFRLAEGLPSSGDQPAGIGHQITAEVLVAAAQNLSAGIPLS